MRWSTEIRGLNYALTIIAMLLLHGSGCTKYHAVSGRVTLDDAPLPDAFISFAPQEGDGDVLVGTTDDRGNYNLAQSGPTAGIVAGRYIVRITTFREGMPEADPPVRPVPERVPDRYNVNSELSVDVDRGNTEHTFDLKSDGRRPRI